MMAVHSETTQFSDADLAERRRAARKLAWILGFAVLLLYAGGLFVSR